MKHTLISRSWGKWLIALLLIAAVAGLFAELMVERPVEANRARQVAGYSVIHPAGWTPDFQLCPVRTDPGEPPTVDLISMSPDHYTGLTPSLYVRRLGGVPDEAQLFACGWSRGEFQNKPALVYENRSYHGLLRRAMMERAGQWFDVGEFLPPADMSHDPEMWAFVETFRYPDGTPATAQASKSSASSSASTRPFEF